MALANLGPLGQEEEMNQYYYISELVCVTVCKCVVWVREYWYYLWFAKPFSVLFIFFTNLFDVLTFSHHLTQPEGLIFHLTWQIFIILSSFNFSISNSFLAVFQKKFFIHVFVFHFDFPLIDVGRLLSTISESAVINTGCTSLLLHTLLRWL